MTKTSGEIAIELRSKFEFYLLALTFSVLGLSIQTAIFDKNLIADAFELLGWLTLFLSGLIGILRAEWIPVAYDVQSKIHRLTRQNQEIRQDLQRGIQVEVPFLENEKETLLKGEDAVAKIASTIVMLENQHDCTNNKIISRYQKMKWTFLIGIGCLMVARGLPPAISITQRILFCEVS